jgi:hypothetical protein
VQIDGTQRAKITALACSQAPLGHARWSLRLWAEKVVELGYVDALSHTHVSEILKKRTPTAPEENLVHRAFGQPFSGAGCPWAVKNCYGYIHGYIHCPMILPILWCVSMNVPAF